MSPKVQKLKDDSGSTPRLRQETCPPSPVKQQPTKPKDDLDVFVPSAVEPKAKKSRKSSPVKKKEEVKTEVKKEAKKDVADTETDAASPVSPVEKKNTKLENDRKNYARKMDSPGYREKRAESEKKRRLQKKLSKEFNDDVVSKFHLMCADSKLDKDFLIKFWKGNINALSDICTKIEEDPLFEEKEQQIDEDN